MLCKLISCTLVAAALGKITWTPTDIQSRRLGLKGMQSHTDTSNADCIVGGYDIEKPLKVYIGGPCSELSCSAGACAPSASLKWVEMESVHMEIVGSDGSVAPFKGVPDSTFIYPQTKTNYEEIGVGGSQHLAVKGMGHAGIFTSTTSYLSKATFSYRENDFIVELEKDKKTIKTSLKQCVVPCCANPGSTECACTSGCPTEALQAVPGAFKFSIMAASYNIPTVADSTYVAGVNGNGWEKVVDTFGTKASGSTTQTLQNVNMDFYQVIDFSHMKAGTLTVTAPGGTSKKYVDMAACDITSACSDAAEVRSVTVSSDSEYAITYDFPQTHNVGSWTNTGTSLTTSVDTTRKVEIHCIKPDAATLVLWKMAADTTAAAAMKVVLVRYRFDIAGITATKITDGKWMNYFATITSKDTTMASTMAGVASAAIRNAEGLVSAATRNAPSTLAHFSLLALMAVVTGICFM